MTAQSGKSQSTTNSKSGGNSQQAGPPPGGYFGVPKYGTQPRFIPDNQNGNLAATPVAATQVNVQTSKLDQLDIVKGWKLHGTWTGKWTKGTSTFVESPFFPVNVIQALTVKLQSAYNTFNLTGPLASIMQAYRPMWGRNQLAQTNPDAFAYPKLVSHTDTNQYTVNVGIDLPAAIAFDEYYDLSSTGEPSALLHDAIVSPVFMAAQARVVIPTVTLAPGISTADALSAPVTYDGSGSGAFATGGFTGTISRDCWWSSANAASNPPQHPWMYTRDYFTQPTSGQDKVSCLIQNTGVSVGQVMSLAFFVWDPEDDTLGTNFGRVVPNSSIEYIEVVIGGSLQKYYFTPQALTDLTNSLYGTTLNHFPSGVNVLDFALDPEGKYLSNKNCINTYLVNGVSLNIKFRSGLAPGSKALVYVGVEALKLVTA